jgi:elongation factor P
MIETSDFKKGVCIVYKGAPMVIVDVTFSTPTARSSNTIVKTKLRNLRTGQLLSDSIRSGERFEEVDLERHPATYLYSDGTRWHFMDDETYEQFELSADDLGEMTGYMKDGLQGLVAMLIDGAVVSVTLPNSVELEVVECDPTLKGATAQAQTKPAKLETGLVIQVPSYLAQGEVVRVDTRDGRFLERAKR